MQKRAFAGTIYDRTPCRIYDVDKQELIKECGSLTEAAHFLGISPTLAHKIVQNKARNKTNLLNKTITIRSGKCKA